MTDSMIERVAKALSNEPDEYWRDIARKAVEAMRVPTKEMLLAAETPISYDWRGAGTNPSPCVSWPRMIDAALNSRKL